MEEKEVKKPTYEELQAQVSKYEQEIAAYKGLNNQLYQQLMGANMQNLYKRLDYLFMVVRYEDSFKSDFVVSCIEEIQQIMTPVESKEDNKE